MYFIEVEDGFRNVRSLLLDQINQTKHLIATVNHTYHKDQNKIHEIFASLHQLINKHEATLQENISIIVNKNEKELKEYETRLLNMEISIDTQERKFYEILSERQHLRLLQSDYRSVDYLNNIYKELTQLKPPTGTEYEIQGFETLSKIKEEILQCGRIESKLNQSLEYQNPRLEKKILEQMNENSLDLSDQRLNDQDMEILVKKCNESTVRNYIHS